MEKAKGREEQRRAWKRKNWKQPLTHADADMCARHARAQRRSDLLQVAFVVVAMFGEVWWSEEERSGVVQPRCEGVLVFDDGGNDEYVD